MSVQDLKNFVSNRVVSVGEACEILHCSKQNISDLIKRGKLIPIQSKANTIILMKNNIIKRKWN